MSRPPTNGANPECFGIYQSMRGLHVHSLLLEVIRSVDDLDLRLSRSVQAGNAVHIGFLSTDKQVRS